MERDGANATTSVCIQASIFIHLIPIATTTTTESEPQNVIQGARVVVRIVIQRYVAPRPVRIWVRENVQRMRGVEQTEKSIGY